MKVKLLGSATDDLFVGYRFYERQVAGMDVHFLKSLFSDIDSLLQYAGIHPIHFGCYRLLGKRFPYAIFYAVEGDMILVRRILDMRRNPDQIRRELN